jgi:hypothetical protein
MNTVFDRGMTGLAIPIGLLWLVAMGAQAGDWVGELMDGSEIRVDPDSHRAYRADGGYERPMWDGVHRLDDGTTVIVNDGIAVPTAQMYSVWEQAGVDAIDRPWCERLVEKSCGASGGCSKSPDCERARALLADERSVRQDGGEAWMDALAACRAGLSDVGFPVCGTGRGLGVARDCEALVRKVCGVDEACLGSEPCNAARQLLALELEERTAAGGRQAQTQTSTQCREALENAFFAACPRE